MLCSVMWLLDLQCVLIKAEWVAGWLNWTDCAVLEGCLCNNADHYK